MQVQAPLELSTFIKHYLFLEVKEAMPFKYRLFANGNTNLVFTIHEGVGAKEIGGNKLAKPIVLGQIGSSIDLTLSPKTKIVVVVFQPFGLNLLTNVPGRELTGSIVEAEQVLGNDIREIESRIVAFKNSDDVIKTLNAYFLDLFIRRKNRPKTEVPLIINEILKKKGVISIPTINSQFCLHKRKLQRLFADQVGLSPKKFIQVARLHAFIGDMKRTEHLTHAAFENGFYDQSHLIKEFKALTQMTPSQYLNSNSLAVNLVGLK